ncbi:MAG: sugar phosphate isomerase/epimerase [Opitutaceae bacterium]|nr:sugar phosphate isomerase/epimerase [Opitutaceae bacterium]
MAPRKRGASKFPPVCFLLMTGEEVRMAGESGLAPSRMQDKYDGRMSLRIPITAFALSLGVTISSFAANTAKVVRDHIGIQLYSLRVMTAKEGAIPALDLVKSWGLKEVETAGTANLPAADFKKLLDERGLKPVASHVGFSDLEKNIDGVIRDLKTLGVTYGIVPSIPHKDDFDDAAALRAAEKFNTWAKAFEKAGLKFGYHPHGFEFRKSQTPGADRVFDVLIGATDPKRVFFEMDVFWVYHAGVDPISLLKKYPTRWVALHVKDLRKGAPRGPMLGKAPPTDKVAVGLGEIEWPKLFNVAVNLGIRHFFIEDETLAPLDNIPKSIAYMRNLPLK